MVKSLKSLRWSIDKFKEENPTKIFIDNITLVKDAQDTISSYMDIFKITEPDIAEEIGKSKATIYDSYTGFRARKRKKLYVSTTIQILDALENMLYKMFSDIQSVLGVPIDRISNNMMMDIFSTLTGIRRLTDEYHGD